MDDVAALNILHAVWRGDAPQSIDTLLGDAPKSSPRAALMKAQSTCLIAALSGDKAAAAAAVKALQECSRFFESARLPTRLARGQAGRRPGALRRNLRRARPRLHAPSLPQTKGDRVEMGDRVS